MNMDLVISEGPLDNSFQKCRRELVSKGSLGRRRKPSRTNLRLILSPADDRQDIGAFHQNHQRPHSDVNFSESAEIGGGPLTNGHHHSEDSSTTKFRITNSNHQSYNRFHNSADEESTKRPLTNGHQSEDSSTTKFRIANSNHQSYNKFLHSPEQESAKIGEPLTNGHHSEDSSTTKFRIANSNHQSYNRFHHSPEEESTKRGGPLTNGHSLEDSTTSKFRIANSNHQSYNRFQQSCSPIISDNYREVVASINQIYSLRSTTADINGNSDCHESDNLHRIAGQSLIDCPPTDRLQSDLRSVAKNQKNNVVNAKVPSGDCDQNGYHCLNGSGSRNEVQLLRIGSQSDRVAAKNKLNCITFSNRRQITTSTPVEKRKPTSSNGIPPELTTSQRSSHNLHKESSLPRELSLVAEAQQFSIEAKLRRQKSESRSDILVRTWERRTQAELWRRAPKSRFGAMPDSYKYKGSLQNGRSLGAPRARDVVSPDEAMLYRVPGQRHRGYHDEPLTNGGHVTVNGNSLGQEPEWISLSKKLCAKFVEGHIESPISPDSYSYEEPEGVKPETPLNCQKTPPGATTPQSQVDASKKKKMAPSVCEESAPDGEPPWIHLSRKLCNKFIEEHIEYPPITNGHLSPVVPPDLVEPNGDVRIIERVGQPKKQKLKQKESEPEWISLSKRLRAKFIESHLDDPDTIALDNQLNASDPEETGSDVSQDLTAPKENGIRPVECRNFILKTQMTEKEEEDGKNFEDQLAPENSVVFPDKECCWEYQEMEFDQESISGNFHEPEVPVEPLQEARIHRGTLPEEDDLDVGKDLATFVNHENSQFVQNAECFNNDVKFLPLDVNAAMSSEGSEEPSKLITVQFIAHSKKDSSDKRESKSYVPYFSKSSVTGSHTKDSFNERESKSYVPEFSNSSVTGYHTKDSFNERESKSYVPEFSKSSVTGSHTKDSFNERESKSYVPYFSKNSSVTGSHSNLSAWEEACFVENADELSKNENVDSSKKVLSKSLDNLCDSLEPNTVVRDEDFEYIDRRDSLRKTWNSACDDLKLSHSGDPNLNEECDKFSVEAKQDIENSDTEDVAIKTDEETSHFGKIQNNHKSTSRVESSSDDEVFECDTASDGLSSKVSANSYGKISSRKIPAQENERRNSQADHKSVKHPGSNTANGKNLKCNGMIPNSIYNGFSSESSSRSSESTNSVQNVAPKEPVKLGMSKWITMSKSEQNLNRSENTKSKSTAQKESKSSAAGSGVSGKEKKGNDEIKMNGKPRKDSDGRKRDEKQRKDSIGNGMIAGNRNTPKISVSPENSRPKYANYQAEFHENSNGVNGFTKEFDFKNKCKSMCDISSENPSFRNGNGYNHHHHHESVADLSPSRKTTRRPMEIEFQHFESESEIPLCAKLVSRHEKRTMPKSSAPSPKRREESPSFSETSHVYEDMFKETPSGPSDSETSSWVMKNNTYYVNDRSCSMNDLDLSDSGSMSVKCDYASSSQNSTLRSSRHSSLASSSFYVNLRDYDSHMLEPTLSKAKSKSTDDGVQSSFSRSSPPTPESLRHLFTSPLSSIHPNRLLNRMPSDPQCHYYSTAAAATSSAFKHGFSSAGSQAPKPKSKKKAERSSSLKIKDIAHGIMLTFRKFQGSKGPVSSSQVDVSHLAEMNGNCSESGKKKNNKNNSKSVEKGHYWTVNGTTVDTDSGFLSDAQRAKARRSSSDLTDMRSNSEFFRAEQKKKGKGGKKSANRDKEKKSRSKSSDSRTVPTVSRKIQQMADGTLYLVTTVSGDSSMPGVYSDSPDTSSELSVHRSVKAAGESNC